MTQIFPMVVIVGVGSVLLATILLIVSGWTWKRFLTLSVVIYMIGITVGYSMYRNAAKIAFYSDSPDGAFRVVVYRLPNFSMAPGSGSDAPAIVRLYNSHGKLLEQEDLFMVQMAEVSWGDGEVWISEINWKTSNR